MCGIVGYVGKREAQDILLSGLRRLEYRGYDSAGIVTIGDTPTLLRAVGKVAELGKKVEATARNDTTGIGHTRWATHGVPNEENAHPHQAGDIYLVHNGIIENYKAIKKSLKNHEFKSDTDTEVLAALINELYQREDVRLEDAVTQALKVVDGAYGIAVISTREPNKIVAARMGSPLLIGVGEGETLVASDASAIMSHTDKVIYLSDGELAICTAGNVELRNLTSQPISAKIETIETDLQTIQKDGYDHFLIKEIMEQPETIKGTLSGRVLKNKNMIRLGGLNMSDSELREVENVFIVACGTASYAGQLASYYFEELMDDVVVHNVIASEMRYRRFNVPDNSIAIFVSQSGETADTLACLKEMKRRGVKCLGAINAVGSTIAREVDGGVYLHAGAEISVASTKAFTSQVSALLLIALVMAQTKGLSPEVLSEYVDDFDMLSEQISKTLDEQHERVKELALKYYKYEHALFMGRGELFPLALEGALKLKETSYIHAEGQAAGELKHGSIALVDDSFFEFAFVDNDWLFDKSVSNIVEVQSRGGHVIVVTNSKKDIEAEELVVVETSLKHLTPLVYNVISQLFAYYVAVERGNDVDQPRNLAKSVTVE
jgi:glucosamine--fructose-6-phosphate aminotransferase (isomerizing)